MDSTKNGAGKKHGGYWRSCCLGVLAASLALVASFYFFPIATVWSCGGAFGLLGATFLGYVIWYALVGSHRAEELIRIARKPLLLKSKGGQAQNAEIAFHNAMARAKTLATNDFRRALMLSELAKYLEVCGKTKEAASLNAESLTLAEANREAEPAAYVWVLNNHALYQLHMRNFPQAQEHFEKALDWIAVARTKAAAGTISLRAMIDEADGAVRSNIVSLLVEMSLPENAREHLPELESQLARLDQIGPSVVRDGTAALLAYWHLKMKDLAKAEALCEQIRASDSFLFVRVRVKIHLERGEYAQAELLLKDMLTRELLVGAVSRLKLFDPMLDFAELRFQQGQLVDAWLNFDMAHQMLKAHGLFRDSNWLEVVRKWLQRARDLGKTDLAASLEAELQQIPATANQAITILEKFRIHPQAPE